MSVDWDLLADHLGDALADTPDRERVARLIETDPEWRAAADTLRDQLELVAADLARLPAPAMPDDVTDRLETALAAAGADGPTPDRGDGVTTPLGRSTGARRSPAGPGSGPVGPGRRGGRRRRRRRAAAAAAVLALAVAAGGVGVWGTDLLPGSGADRTASGGVTDDRAAALVTPDPLLLTSGRDYDRSTLLQSRPATGRQAAPGSRPRPETAEESALEGAPDDGMPGPDVDARSGPGAVPESVPAELARLWRDPTALTACLRAVAAEFAPDQVRVRAVDLARFRGEPAVVLWLDRTGSEPVTWVSGPRCGLDGADRRFRAVPG